MKFQRNHTHSSKLSPMQVLELRQRYAEEGWTQGRCARFYGISVGQVGRIVRGESWQQYTKVQSDKELEHQALEEKVIPQELDASVQNVLQKLKAPEGAEPSEDLLDLMLRSQGDPLGDFKRRRNHAADREVSGEVQPGMGEVSEAVQPGTGGAAEEATRHSSDVLHDGLGGGKQLEGESHKPDDRKIDEKG